ASITMSQRRTYRATSANSTSATTTGSRRASTTRSGRGGRSNRVTASGCGTLRLVPAKPKPERNGPLKIPLDFDEAVRAALEVPPEPASAKPRKPRRKGAGPQKGDRLQS